MRRPWIRTALPALSGPCFTFWSVSLPFVCFSTSCFLLHHQMGSVCSIKCERFGLRVQFVHMRLCLGLFLCTGAFGCGSGSGPLSSSVLCSGPVTFLSFVMPLSLLSVRPGWPCIYVQHWPFLGFSVFCRHLYYPGPWCGSRVAFLYYILGSCT